MNKTPRQNKVMIFTTLSVYLGLVLVGASPNVLALTDHSQSGQPHSFEINTRTASVFSKIEFHKSQKRIGDSNGHFWCSAERMRSSDMVSNADLRRFAIGYAKIACENNQVRVISNFPRASI